MDYSEITQNNEVIKLLKKRKEIEDKIYKLDENALINYELKLLNSPRVEQINGWLKILIKCSHV